MNRHAHYFGGFLFYLSERDFGEQMDGKFDFGDYEEAEDCKANGKVDPKPPWTWAPVVMGVVVAGCADCCALT